MASRSSFVSMLFGCVAATAFGCSYPVSDFTVTSDGGATDTSTGGGDTGAKDTDSGSDTTPAFDTTPSLDGSCTPPTQNCSGVCIDTNSDPNHCGSCDHKCDGSQKCLGGKCRGG